MSGNPLGEGGERRNAATLLGLIRERGKQGVPLEDVYRQLDNPQRYLYAYGRSSRNPGAMTPGSTAETAEGMSLATIASRIDELRHERYQWRPVRRVYREKKHAMKKRPLGVPPWADKLRQDGLRLILEAYDEPQCSRYSQGVRPKRGCHTAFQESYQRGVGTKGCIEGDITAGFDSLTHPILLSILRERLHDTRFLRRSENLLRAGYLEDWPYTATLSGSPQGAGVSPILSSLYLSKLAAFVEQTLLPTYTRGTRRSITPPWERLRSAATTVRRGGRPQAARRLRRHRQTVPALDPHDPTDRRLSYGCYAADWLLGFSGPRSEAEESKPASGAFLRA